MLDKTGEPGADRSLSEGGRRGLRSAREALHPDAPPPPPRRPRRRRRPILATISGLLSFAGIAAIALVVVWSLGMQRLNAPGPLTADRVIEIQPGNDLSVVDQLASAGVIDDRMLMTAAVWLGEGRGNLKAGEYQFKAGASVRDVIDLLVSGKQLLHSITIPEGLTSEQIVDRLREDDVLIGDIVNVPAEGTLMPETYKFSRGTTRDQVIRSMEARETKTLNEVWAHRAADLPIRSPFEMLTLASIVEKETGRADERPRVAGVFINRLQRNMPLQSDPTIVYGLVGGKGTLGRGILKSEVDQKTPYNTYQITGLPPGPIANPGKAALEAVANPSRTRDLYFVADGTGGHAFADNLAQHSLNVQRWRQIEKDQKDKASPDAATPGLPGPAKRGDADEMSGTALAYDISGGSAGRIASVTSFPVNGLSIPSAAPQPAAATAAVAPAAAATGYDELDVEVGGMKSRSDPATWGSEDTSFFRTGSSPDSFPVSQQKLADTQARAAAFGLPSPVMADPGATAAQPTATPSSAPGSHLYGKGKIIDASEGTSLDPLKDRTYDLSSAKVVPLIKALPPVQPLASRN